MKQPDEWRTRFDRWYCVIIGAFMLVMTIIVFVTLFAFAIQLEYELKVDVLS